MDELAASAVIHAPPEEVYALLADFTRYPRYATHLVGVEAEGDGGPGTRYALQFEWWKLSYTARSEVTDVNPPWRIDWRVLEDVEARGCWRVEPLHRDHADEPADSPNGSANELARCRVWFEVAFDPGSVSAGAVALPRFVSLSWVVDRLQPLVREEAERVVERIVADLEGRRRSVDVTIHDRAPGL